MLNLNTPELLTFLLCDGTFCSLSIGSSIKKKEKRNFTFCFFIKDKNMK